MPDGEEKQYPATPKRREDARKKGQVARSQEFGPALTLLTLVTVLHATIPSSAGPSLIGDFNQAFHFSGQNGLFGYSSAYQWEMNSLIWMTYLVGPLLLCAVVAAAVSGLGQVGFNITPEALAPQWTRVDPVQGFKRLFSSRGSVELLKGIVKMSIVGVICYNVLSGEVTEGHLFMLMRSSLPVTLGYVGALIWTIGLRVGVCLFLMAAADYAYQRHEFEKNIKMTASEIKQEMKQSEGDPQIKGKIRRLQREIAQRRMMQDVPKADVIITNPTHFAVAIKYEAGSRAPKVVAKGQDIIAMHIRELARENHVPLVENKVLARALYKDVEIGQEIPGDLYEGVARVLAFVYRTYKNRRTA